MDYRFQAAVDEIYTAAKNIEELFHKNAVILPNFPRCIQLDLYSCGARAVYTVLRYFKRKCSIVSVEEALRTDYSGTSIADIKRVFLEKKLVFKELKRASIKHIRRAIDSGSPLLVSIDDLSHYCVVYGYSDTHVFAMDPLFTSFKCAIRLMDWRKKWDGWGLVVSRK